MLYTSISFEFSHIAVLQRFPVLYLPGRGKDCTFCPLMVGWGHMTMMHLWVEAMCHFWAKASNCQRETLQSSCFPSVGGSATSEMWTALSSWVLEKGLCDVQIPRKWYQVPKRKTDQVAHSRDDLINNHFDVFF